MSHTASTIGEMSPAGVPAWRVGGGLITAMRSNATPATCAGTASMISVENNTAVPPGTVRPTLSTGVNRMPSSAPSSAIGGGSAGLTCS